MSYGGGYVQPAISSDRSASMGTNVKRSVVNLGMLGEYEKRLTRGSASVPEPQLGGAEERHHHPADSALSSLAT
jgi:hypothetical protein